MSRAFPKRLGRTTAGNAGRRRHAREFGPANGAGDLVIGEADRIWYEIAQAPVVTGRPSWEDDLPGLGHGFAPWFGP
jgi:hypothetical protein